MCAQNCSLAQAFSLTEQTNVKDMGEKKGKIVSILQTVYKDRKVQPLSSQ